MATTLTIDVKIDYAIIAPTSLLLQIEVAETPSQKLIDDLRVEAGCDAHKSIPALNEIGTRRWLSGKTHFSANYSARVAIDREPVNLQRLNATPLTYLPAETVPYLFASRYCPLEPFFEFTQQKFADLEGGQLILAMAEWIRKTLRYDPAASQPETDAADTLAKQAGVCRDYAHLLIAMARACSIPARMVSTYGPDVSPQDFHAVAEVYLDGRWHLVDPTGMAKAEDMAIIGVGRDAVDIAFLTGFAPLTLKKQTVSVHRINASSGPLARPSETATLT